MTFDDWFNVLEQFLSETEKHTVYEAKDYIKDAFEVGLQEGIDRTDRGTD